MSGVGIFVVLAIVLFGTAAAAVAVLAVTVIRRDRRRREELRAYAAQAGWWPVAGPAAGPAQLPGPVAEDARSRRCKLAFGARRGRYDVWMVWHQWVESTGDSSTTRNLTRYYLWLGPSHPDIALRRRTGIGAFFKPVRGAGTGDAAFDRAVLVRPGDGGAQWGLLTPPLREALLARRLPLFQITGGVLITRYGDVPRIDNLDARAAAICELADALG
jgi:hypothetical protein